MSSDANVLCCLCSVTREASSVLCCGVYKTLIIPKLLMDMFLRPCCSSGELFLLNVVYVIVAQNKIRMQCIFISQDVFKNLVVTKQVYLRLGY